MRTARYDGEPNSAGVEPLLITMEDLQRILGCGKTTAFSIVGSGKIETVQVGRRRMAVFESAKAFVANLREHAKVQEAA